MEAGVGVDLRDMEACLFRMKKIIQRTEQQQQQQQTTTVHTGASGATGAGKDGRGQGKAKANAKAAASKLSALAGKHRLYDHTDFNYIPLLLTSRPWHLTSLPSCLPVYQLHSPFIL